MKISLHSSAQGLPKPSNYHSLLELITVTMYMCQICFYNLRKPRPLTTEGTLTIPLDGRLIHSITRYTREIDSTISQQCKSGFHHAFPDEAEQ